MVGEVVCGLTWAVLWAGVGIFVGCCGQHVRQIVMFGQHVRQVMMFGQHVRQVMMFGHQTGLC